MDSDRQALIDGLREFATFLESRPQAPTPVPGQFNVFVINKEQYGAAARAIGGKLTKQHQYQEYAVLRRTFGPIKYDLNVSRQEICEAVVVGKRIVPAVEAQPEREEDVIEWKCGTAIALEVSE